MAQLFELNSFVGKFVNLWQTGKNATLKLESRAGQASVNLQLDLGHQLPHHPLVQGQDTARHRRRQKRAEHRKSAAEKAADDEAATAVNREAEEASENGVIVKDSVAAEEVVALDQVVDVTEEAAEEVVDHENVANEIAAAEAVTDFKCDLCDKTFNGVRALRAHQGRTHKATRSPIPQLDGESEVLENCVTYTFVSEYALDDIEYTLREIFPEEQGVKTNLVSRVKTIGPWNADHFCTVQLELPFPQHFSWSVMIKDQAEVFNDLQKQ